MKQLSWILLFILFTTGKSISQDLTWHTRLYTFFDNTEFSGSAFTIPQTMAGVMLAPDIGLRWDSVHSINVGVNLMHEFGSSLTIDKFYPTAYYEYLKGPFRFLMGAFPRSPLLDRYPRSFFRDSISYYRPNVNGIFMEYSKNKSYINVWLDWTGRQTESVHEAFFVGISGRYSWETLYLQHFGYMYHYAAVMNPVVEEALHDNTLFQTSFGLDLSGRTILDKLDLNAGWIIGLERARADNTGWIAQNGFLFETNIEYRYFGLLNSFYRGSGLMYFYNDHGDDLYWGDPLYRAKTYNRSDLYLRLSNNKKVDIKLTWSLHFLESKIYNEQMLKVVVNLNNL
jgi:hypothetical protein